MAPPTSAAAARPQMDHAWYGLGDGLRRSAERHRRRWGVPSRRSRSRQRATAPLATAAKRPLPQPPKRELAGLLAALGPPLVLKSDNGSAFGEDRGRVPVAQLRRLQAVSPPRTPNYNGAMKAGIGSLKAQDRGSRRPPWSPRLFNLGRRRRRPAGSQRHRPPPSASTAQRPTRPGRLAVLPSRSTIGYHSENWSRTTDGPLAANLFCRPPARCRS